MPPPVETAFVILDRASGPVRGIRREVRGLGRDAERAGRSLDRMTSPREIRELQQMSRHTRLLGSAVNRVGTQARDAAPHLARYSTRLDTTRRETERLTRETDRLVASLRVLGAIDARPRVHIDGIAEARAELAMLRAELRSFGGTRTASVGVRRTGTVGGFGRVGGGGSFGRSMTRSSLRSVNLGPFTLGPNAGAAMFAGALPVAQSLIGAGGAGLATLGGATLGLGGLGVAGLGTGIAGAGSIAAILGPAKQGLKDLRDAQEKLNDAIADYGRRSQQAARAQWELRQAERAAPAGASGLLTQQRALGRDWRRQTRPGQAHLFAAGEYGLRALRNRSPAFAGMANRVSRSFHAQARGFADFATAPEQMLLMRRLTGQFANDLGYVTNSIENTIGAMGNLARASLPFFHDGMQFMERWTEGWRDSTSDIVGTRQKMRGYMDDLRAFGRVAENTADLVGSIFGPARSSGRGMFDDLNEWLIRTDEWAKRNPDRIKDFFDDSVNNAEKLARFMGMTVKELDRLADTIGPVVGGLADLAGLAGGYGLLLPMALRAGYGRMTGRGGGGGAAGMPIIAGPGGMPGAGGGAGAGAALGAAGGFAGAAVLGWGAAAAANRTRMGQQLGQRWSPPIGPPRRASGDLRGARYGGPVSQLGPARATAGQRIGAGAAATGRFVGPAMLIAGGLGVATSEGPWYERVSSGMNSMSLGLVPVRMGPESAARAGEQQAWDVISRLQGDPQENVRALQDEIDRIRGTRGQGRGGLTGTIGALASSNPVTAPLATALGFGALGESLQNRELSARDAARVNALMAAIDEEQKRVDSQRAAERRIGAERSRLHGADLADSLQRSFEVRTSRGPKAERLGPREAMDRTLHGAFMKMSAMKPEGAEVLGEQMLDWAAQMERENPKLKGAVDDLTDYIKRAWSRMGRHVEIVDGNILRGTRSEWKQIAAALTDPAERALQKVSDAFTEIQRQAVGALMAMGYSRGEANDIVRAQERGGSKGAQNVVTGISARKGDTGASRSRDPVAAAPAGPPAPGTPFGGMPARGPFGEGIGHDLASRAAPAGRLSSGQAAGSRSGEPAKYSHNALMGANPSLAVYAQLAAQTGNRVTSGYRPGAITTSGNASYHGTRNALDLSGGDMRALSYELYTKYGRGLEELITPYPEFNLKDGRPFRYSDEILAQHKDHVHVADVDPAGMMGMAFSPDTFGPGLQPIQLTPPKSGIPGVFGALADAASAAYTQGLMAKLGAGPQVGPGGAQASAGGQFNKAQLASIWAQANPGLGDPMLMAAIALAESGGNPGAQGPVTRFGFRAGGLWQIHPPQPGWQDPLINARMAGEKLRTQGLGAWEAYTRGMHQRFMGDGLGRILSTVKMVAAASGGGGRTVSVHAPITVSSVGADGPSIRAQIHRELDAVLDVALRIVESGPEESSVELMG